jgi:hypothetical protein
MEAQARASPKHAGTLATLQHSPLRGFLDAMRPKRRVEQPFARSGTDVCAAPDGVSPRPKNLVGR